MGSRSSSRSVGAMFCLALSLVLCATDAHATFLRLVPDVTTKIDDVTKNIHLRFRVQNDGDEPALNVGVELPTINEAYVVAARLEPGESADVEVNVSPQQVSLPLRGKYLIPYRVQYKDLNQYRFSSPYALPIVVAPEPEQLVAMMGTNGAGPIRIDLVDRAEATVRIVNISSQKLSLQELRAFTPAEILNMPSLPRLPVELAPQQSVELTIALTNASALIGSSYLNIVVASGAAGNSHFAEAFTFQVNIVPENQKPRMMLGVLVLALVLFTLQVMHRRRLRRSL